MTNETITEDFYNKVDQLPAKPSVFTGRTAILIGVSTLVMGLGLAMALVQYARSSYSSESSVGMLIIVALAAAIAMLATFWYQFKTLRNALGTLGDKGRGLAEKMYTILILIPTAIAVTVLLAVLAPSKGGIIAIHAFAGIYLGWLTYNLGSSISEEFDGRLGKLGKLIEYDGIINILCAIINPFMSFAEDESQVAIVMILSGLVMIAQFAVGIWASVVFDRLFVAYYPTAADGQPAGAMQSLSSTVNRVATANAADNRQPTVEPPVAEPVAQTTPEPVVEKPAEATLPPEEQPVANENQAEEPQKINPKMWILIAGLLVLGIAAGWFVSRPNDSTYEDAQIVITDEEEFEEEEVVVTVAGNYKMTGTIDAKWPVTMWLSVDENGNAKGRYCYDRTIDKYGDKAENYFYLDGHLYSDGDLYLTSNKWGEREYFERFTLKINGSVASGSLKNTNSDNIHTVMFDNVIKAQL